MQDLQNVVDKVAIWSDETFGKNRIATAPLHHLKKEVSELIEAIEKRNEMIKNGASDEELGEQMTNIFYEFADCGMLLFDSARMEKIQVADFPPFMDLKLDINKLREWSQPDENGVVEHVRD